MTTTRPPKYWRDFAAHGELRATEVKSGRQRFKPGRGAYLVGLALKQVNAGLWTDVQVRAWKSDRWIDLADVVYREHGEK